MRILFTLLIWTLTFSLLAQSPQQSLRGHVKEATVKTPLMGVTLSLFNKDGLQINATDTDSTGFFFFENIHVGRYQIKAQYLGYSTKTLSEILVETGKTPSVLIEMEEDTYKLEQVTVSSARQTVNHPVSVKTLTIEEVQRFPATYFDPARLAIATAGVVNTNDQSNGISVRGHSPNALAWRLEGAEIVNPNHTPNAGTFSDRISLNGGGVNMLSAQMLGNTSFLTGAIPVGYGNTLSAVADMNLRNGNEYEHEFTVQAGLIGIDLAAEGPIGEKASFLANYRYSTVGLLSQIGVDLGDEEISFQDLAVKADIRTKKGKFSVFGIGGTSKNIFAAQRDTSVWEVQKDRFDIDFNSQTAIGGMSYGQSIGANSYWKTSLVYSITDNTRSGTRLSNNLETSLLEKDEITYSKTSLHSVFTHKYSPKTYIKAGIHATNHSYSVFSENLTTQQLLRGEDAGILAQPYFNYHTKISPRLSLNLGLQYSYFTANDTDALEPRASISMQINPHNRLSLAYGLQAQMQSPLLYLSNKNIGDNSPSLELSRAHHYVLAYNLRPSNGDKISIEAYYQDLFRIPQTLVSGTTFSALNLIENFTTEPLESKGTGRNLGLEFSWQKYFTGSFYYLINATFYDSKYTDIDGKEHNTAFNGNYASNVTAGKEWIKDKGDKVSILGLNLRIGYAGGFRYTPIDLEASRLAGTTIYLSSKPFTEQYPDYFKTDARIYWKKNKSNRSSTLALDLQNLTNQDNVAFEYFDPEAGEVITKFQLGLLPILTWRLEF